MGVSEYKRGESNKLFLANYRKLRKEVNQILMRDFGIKPRSYSVELLHEIYNLEETDRHTLETILNKYGMDSSEINKYPPWLIADWRTNIRHITAQIGTEIELANNIYISKECPNEEYAERRKHWTLAIGYCNALKDALNEVLDCVSVKVSAYELVFEKLQKEMLLLKAIRKSDKKALEKALQK
jgi:hypothetical protein